MILRLSKASVIALLISPSYSFPLTPCQGLVGGPKPSQAPPRPLSRRGISKICTRQAAAVDHQRAIRLDISAPNVFVLRLHVVIRLTIRPSLHHDILHRGKVAD